MGNPYNGNGLQPSRFYDLMEGIGLEMCDSRRKATPQVRTTASFRKVNVLYLHWCNLFFVQDVGTTLWAFATSEFFHADIYRGIASRLDYQRSRDYKPQELSNILWALANNPNLSTQFLDIFDTTFAPASARKEMMNRADPVTICFATAANELMRRPYDFKSQEIKDVLWSFSKVRM